MSHFRRATSECLIGLVGRRWVGCRHSDIVQTVDSLSWQLRGSLVWGLCRWSWEIDLKRGLGPDQAKRPTAAADHINANWQATKSARRLARPSSRPVTFHWEASPDGKLMLPKWASNSIQYTGYLSQFVRIVLEVPMVILEAKNRQTIEAHASL